MQKQEIEIGGYKITQLSDTTFEAGNPNENLDFYFEINEDDEVDVFVFDSEIKYSGEGANIDPFLASYTYGNLVEAVSVSCSVPRKEFKLLV